MYHFPSTKHTHTLYFTHTIFVFCLIISAIYSYFPKQRQKATVCKRDRRVFCEVSSDMMVPCNAKKRVKILKISPECNINTRCPYVCLISRFVAVRRRANQTNDAIWTLPAPGWLQAAFSEPCKCEASLRNRKFWVFVGLVRPDAPRTTVYMTWHCLTGCDTVSPGKRLAQSTLRNTRFGLEAGFANADRVARNKLCCEELTLRAFVCLDEETGNRFREETWKAT